MVNSVRFGTTAGQFSSFQDLVSKPQTYRQSPSASTGIYETKKKGKAKKVIIGTLATAAVVAGAMLGTRRYSAWLTDKISKIGNAKIKAFAQGATNFMAKGGDKIVQWGGIAKDGATKLWNKAKDALKRAATAVQEGAEEVVIEVEPVV